MCARRGECQVGQFPRSHMVTPHDEQPHQWAKLRPLPQWCNPNGKEDSWTSIVPTLVAGDEPTTLFEPTSPTEDDSSSRIGHQRQNESDVNIQRSLTVQSMHLSCKIMQDCHRTARKQPKPLSGIPPAPDSGQSLHSVRLQWHRAGHHLASFASAVIGGVERRRTKCLVPPTGRPWWEVHRPGGPSGSRRHRSIDEGLASMLQQPNTVLLCAVHVWNDTCSKPHTCVGMGVVLEASPSMMAPESGAHAPGMAKSGWDSPG